MTDIIADAIAGARNGTHHPLPSAWIERLEAAPRLITLADRLS